MSPEEVEELVKKVLKDGLTVEVSTEEKSDYGYGGCTVGYVQVKVDISLDGEVIHSSTDNFSLPSCQN